MVLGVDVEPGAFVRPPGSDIGAGEVLLEKGEIITSAAIGVLATCGLTKVLCFPQPVVGVMSTGNELVEPCTKELAGSQVKFRYDIPTACHPLLTSSRSETATDLPSSLR